MRRDVNKAVERMDHILRCERQLRRWLLNPPDGVAEEDYEELHLRLREAEAALSGAYRQWHGIGHVSVTVRPEPNVDAQDWHVAVNGQATIVTADPKTTLSEILTDALLQTGNERWGGEDRWEFVNPRGALLDASAKLGELDPSLTSPSGCCLFIQLRPGVGA